MIVKRLLGPLCFLRYDMKITDNSENKNENIVKTTELVLKRSCIDQDVTITDWDLDRIYLDIDGTEYIVRMWNIHENPKTAWVTIQWTLFVDNGQGSCDKVSDGTLRFKCK